VHVREQMADQIKVYNVGKEIALLLARVRHHAPFAEDFVEHNGKQGVGIAGGPLADDPCPSPIEYNLL